MLKNIQCIGYACGNGGGDSGSCMGPNTIQHTAHWDNLALTHAWRDTVYPRDIQKGLAALSSIADCCDRLGRHVAACVSAKQRFCVIGGDHSAAIGTWSGVTHALAQQSLGLIWIDAHLDGHTPASSPSQNIHGMPLACLLGHGPTELTRLLHDALPKLQPQHIHIIGARDYEPEEKQLLTDQGVHIHYMEEVEASSIHEVLGAAVQHLSKETDYFGLSIDVDGIDPEDAPGVATRVAGGIRGEDLLAALRAHLHQHPHCVGMEVVEFNPHLDQDAKTERLVIDCINAVYG